MLQGAGSGCRCSGVAGRSCAESCDVRREGQRSCREAAESAECAALLMSPEHLRPCAVDASTLKINPQGPTVKFLFLSLGGCRDVAMVQLCPTLLERMPGAGSAKSSFKQTWCSKKCAV